MKQLFLSVFVIAMAASCGNNDSAKKNTTGKDSVTVTPPARTDTPVAVPDMHNAENAISYEGTYAGTLPCASCEGIETTIVLKADKSFTMKEVYKGGKEGGTFDSKGSYEVKGNTLSLKFSGGDADRSAVYHVGETDLKQLDADGKEITGPMANNYILKKK